MKFNQTGTKSPIGLPAGDDLITDFILQSASEDQFDANHLVQELAALIDHQDPASPATIALFGAWGSGKSSIARLLRMQYSHIPTRRRWQRSPVSESTAFVHFDAFKYAGHSLRRNFLLEVARGLASENGMQDTLYSSVSERRIRLTKRNVWSVTWQVLAFVVLPTAVTAVLGAMAWAGWFSDAALGPGTRAALPKTLSLLSVPAAAGLFALMREAMPSTVTTSSPSSEEQFELEFRGLIDKSGFKRVVIFVDEIDRCAPSEVIETLDTIRTFLDVKGCVVIVAADQQVLERAIAEKVRQASPVDFANPYYSSGSEYIDKVFHYQFSIPPLLPTAISRFALKLTENKGGVWQLVDRESVISVLIPTHVRSPRRVKTLLNSFVLTYRLAHSRNVSTSANRTLSQRATELAVLVCLRVEFPLFANDLPQYPALPDLVRWFNNNGPSGDQQVYEGDATDTKQITARNAKPKASEAAWSLAKSYYEGRTPVDISACEEDERRTPSPSEGSKGGGSESGDTSSSAKKDPHDVSLSEGVTRAGVVKANCDLLVGYLSKTAYIDAPATDLIFMANSQGFFGLDADLAERLADYSLNASDRWIRNVIGDLDDTQQTSALRFLAHRTRETAFGEDGSNMSSSLLVAVEAASPTSVANAVNDVVTAIAQQQSRARLRRSDHRGALRVGLMSNKPEARDLVYAVISSASYETDTDLALQITRNACVIEPRHPNETYQAMGWALIRDPKGFTAAILEMDLDDAAELIRKAGRFIAQITNTTIISGTVPQPEVEPAQPDVASESVGVVLGLLIGSQSRTLGELLGASLAGVADSPSTGLVFNQLDLVGVATVPELSKAALRAALVCPWQDVSRWLKVVTGLHIPNDERISAYHDLVRRFWYERSVEAGDSGPFHHALIEIRRLMAGIDIDVVDLTNDLLEDINWEEVTAEGLNAEYQRVADFVETDVLSAHVVADHLSSCMIASLSGAPLAGQPGSVRVLEATQTWVDNWAEWLALRSSSSSQNALIDAVLTSQRLPSPHREQVALGVAAALGVDSPLNAADMVKLYQAFPSADDLADLMEVWVTKFDIDPHSIFTIAEPHLEGEFPETLSRVISTWSGQTTGIRRAYAALPALEVLPNQPPSMSYLRAVGAPHATAPLLALKLVDQCRIGPGKRWNTTHRGNVLDTWRAIGLSSAHERALLVDGVAIKFIEQSGQSALIQLQQYSDLLHDLPAPARERLLRAIEVAIQGRPKRHSLRRMLNETGIDTTDA